MPARPSTPVDAVEAMLEDVEGIKPVPPRSPLVTRDAKTYLEVRLLHSHTHDQSTNFKLGSQSMGNWLEYQGLVLHSAES